MGYANSAFHKQTKDDVVNSQQPDDFASCLVPLTQVD